MSGKPKTIIVGGSGKVALRLAKLISSNHEVVSIHRSADQTPTIEETGAKSLLLSIEDASVADLTSAFEGAKTVVWSAGAGGKGGEQRTKAVDYEGAVKVFDAIEKLSGTKPHLLLVSAVDVRSDPEAFPPHYNEGDKERSRKMRGALGPYLKYKYLADADLVKRTAFPWTILRPGGLSDDKGTGLVSVGKTHITNSVPRDDVAATLAALVDRPDSNGLALDVVGGETPVEEAVDAAIKRGETDWTG